ncbi:hypothetical protein D3C77_299470 [compost metagenome]
MLVDDITLEIGNFLDHICVGKFAPIGDRAVSIRKLLYGNSVLQSAEHPGLRSIIFFNERGDAELLGELPGLLDAHRLVEYFDCWHVP